MTKGLSQTDLHEILQGFVDPEFIDGSGDASQMTPEQRFLAGTALKTISDRMVKDAKAEMLPRYRGTAGKQLQGRLVVEWSPGGPTVSLVRAAVEASYPPEVRPDFWKEGESKEAIKVSIAAKTVPKARKAVKSRKPKGLEAGVGC